MHFQLKHIGAFTLLFFAAAIRPQAFLTEAHVATGPAIYLALFGTVLLYKLWTAGGYKFVTQTLWPAYKTELSLFFALVVVMLLSWMINFHRYDSVADWIVWGLTFVVMLTAAGLITLLFLLPGADTSSRGWSLSQYKYSSLIPFIILTLVCGLAVWQWLDFRGSQAVWQWFLAGNMHRNFSHIRSVFEINTTFGGQLAAVTSALLLAVASQLPYFRKPQNRLAGLLLLVLFGFTLFVGLLSGARNYLLFIIAALSAFVVLRYWRSPGQLIMSLLLVIALFHLALHFVTPRAANKLETAAPYLQKLHAGDPIQLEDLKPNLGLAMFSGREDLWKRAAAHIRQNPVLGISSGAFRLEPNARGRVNVQGNTHNLFLQTGVNAGVTGIVILGLLILRLAYRLRQRPASLALFIGVLASLQVDMFPEHSFTWTTTVAFAFASLLAWESHQRKLSEAGKKAEVTESSRDFTWILAGCISLVVLLTLVLYLAKLS